MLPSRIQSWTPCADGICPVISDARAGEQTGDVQKKSVKRTPLAAIRSSAGVMMSAFPAQCIAQGPWSSLRMKSTFGREAERLAMVFVVPAKAGIQGFRLFTQWVPAFAGTTTKLGFGVRRNDSK